MTGIDDKYQPAPQFGPSRNQFPPFSNIILVDSLEQALRMPARMHSEMIYWNRYKDEIYRIYTDYNNNKQYMILDVKIQEVPKAKQEEKADAINMSLLLQKLEKLEKKNMEVLNGKHNVDTNVGTSSTDATEQPAANAIK